MVRFQESEAPRLPPKEQGGLMHGTLCTAPKAQQLQAAGPVRSGGCSASRPCPAVLLAAPEQSQPHVCSLAQMPVGLHLSQKKQSCRGSGFEA